MTMPADALGTTRSRGTLSRGPRIIGVGSPGEVVRKQVFQIQLDFSAGEPRVSALGYFTYVPGLEGTALFSAADPAQQNESTAYFPTFSSAQNVRITANGPLIIVDAQIHATAYFNPMPRATFSDPESFKQGTIVATSDDTVQFIFDLFTGSGTGVQTVNQTSASPFMFNSELIQFAEVGAKFTILVQGAFSLLHGLTRVFGAGYILQA